MLKRPQPIPPQPGQESVWDYPRPPRIEALNTPLKIIWQGKTFAQTTQGYRLLETSHPPVYYFPQADIQMDLLKPEPRIGHCEFKGKYRWWSLIDGPAEVACEYFETIPAYRPIQHMLCFYARPFEACYVGDTLVTPQEGKFYSGWITPEIVGPFKGGPDTWGW